MKAASAPRPPRLVPQSEFERFSRVVSSCRTQTSLPARFGRGRSTRCPNVGGIGAGHFPRLRYSRARIPRSRYADPGRSAITFSGCGGDVEEPAIRGARTRVGPCACMDAQGRESEWERTWRYVAVAERLEGPPRPLAAAGLAVLAASLATLLGTRLGADLRPTTLQIAAAAGVAVATLAVVPLALRTTRTRAHLFLVATALLSSGAAAIHYAVIDTHFEEWWGFGVFFVGSGLAQLAWAVIAVTWPSRPLFWLGVLGNAAIVALWIVTRTAGTLLGPDPYEPEPVGLADGIATGFEVVIVLVAVWLATVGIPRWRTLRTVTWIVGAVTLGLTVLALLSVMGAAPDVIPATD